MCITSSYKFVKTGMQAAAHKKCKNNITQATIIYISTLGKAKCKEKGVKKRLFVI